MQNSIFVRTAQISSLATARTGQPLPTYWSYTKQSCTFALTVAALKITYLVYILLMIINLKGIVA